MRPETGPMEFKDDWRGVFIRGDNALYFAMMLQELIKNVELVEDYLPGEAMTVFELQTVKGLVELLQEAQQNPDEMNVQKMKDFSECVIQTCDCGHTLEAHAYLNAQVSSICNECSCTRFNGAL